MQQNTPPSLEEIKQFLREVFHFFEIEIISEADKVIYVAKGYAIEIENERLFKLLHEGSVIAPFDDVEELCQFIRLG